MKSPKRKQPDVNTVELDDLPKVDLSRDIDIPNMAESDVRLLNPKDDIDVLGVVQKLTYDPHNMQFKTHSGMEVDIDTPDGIERVAVSLEEGSKIIGAPVHVVNPEGFQTGISLKDHSVPKPERGLLDYWEELGEKLQKGPLDDQSPEDFIREVKQAVCKIDEARHHPPVANSLSKGLAADTSFSLKNNDGSVTQFRHPDASFEANVDRAANIVSDSLHSMSQTNIKSADQFFRHLTDTRSVSASGTLIYPFTRDNGATTELRVKPIDVNQRPMWRQFLAASAKAAEKTARLAVVTAEVTLRNSWAITNNVMEIAASEIGGGKVNPNDIMPLAFKSQLLVKGFGVPRRIDAEQWMKSCSGLDSVLTNAMTKDFQWCPRKMEIMKDFAVNMPSYERMLKGEELDKIYPQWDERRHFWRKQRERWQKAFIEQNRGWMSQQEKVEDERFMKLLCQTAQHHGPVYRKLFTDSMLGSPLKDAVKTKMLNSARYL